MYTHSILWYIIIFLRRRPSGRRATEHAGPEAGLVSIIISIITSTTIATIYTTIIDITTIIIVIIISIIIRSPHAGSRAIKQSILDRRPPRTG